MASDEFQDHLQSLAEQDAATDLRERQRAEYLMRGRAWLQGRTTFELGEYVAAVGVPCEDCLRMVWTVEYDEYGHVIDAQVSRDKPAAGCFTARCGGPPVTDIS